MLRFDAFQMKNCRAWLVPPAHIFEISQLPFDRNAVCIDKHRRRAMQLQRNAKNR
jgi:hypothetical protein